jgi:hypothetical protein
MGVECKQGKKDTFRNPHFEGTGREWQRLWVGFAFARKFSDCILMFFVTLVETTGPVFEDVS